MNPRFAFSVRQLSYASLAIMATVAVFSAYGSNQAVFGGSEPSPYDLIQAPHASTEPSIESIDAAKSLPVNYITTQPIYQNDTFHSLLSRAHASLSNLSIDNRLKQKIDVWLDKNSGGEAQLTLDRDSQLLSLTLIKRDNPTKQLLITHSSSGYQEKTTASAIDTTIEMKSAFIDSNLFLATDSADIPEAISNKITDIFKGTIDFHQDLQPRDHISIIYEKFGANGNLSKVGNLLAVELRIGHEKYRAFRFQPEKGSANYFDENGSAYGHDILRSPVPYSRITSTFSALRFHPILQLWRSHNGIDYAVPTGTSVTATASGNVDFIGTKEGYGKTIILQHAMGYSTTYAHLSHFLLGISPGSHILQGQTIGWSGATGTVTGPHLHYELRKNGNYLNPSQVRLPAVATLSQSDREKFGQFIPSQIARLDQLSTTNLAAID